MISFSATSFSTNLAVSGGLTKAEIINCDESIIKIIVNYFSNQSLTGVYKLKKQKHLPKKHIQSSNEELKTVQSGNGQINIVCKYIYTELLKYQLGLGLFLTKTCNRNCEE